MQTINQNQYRLLTQVFFLFSPIGSNINCNAIVQRPCKALHIQIKYYLFWPYTYIYVYLFKPGFGLNQRFLKFLFIYFFATSTVLWLSLTYSPFCTSTYLLHSSIIMQTAATNSQAPHTS